MSDFSALHPVIQILIMFVTTIVIFAMGYSAGRSAEIQADMDRRRKSTEL